MKHGLPHMRVWNDSATNLLLFPEDSSSYPEACQLTNASPTSQSFAPGNFPPSLGQIIAEWQTLLKRLGRRRRLLETVLAAGRPIRLTDDTLDIGFSPQRRFHRELLDLPEYRDCVEEELTRTFRVRLSVVTAWYPENRHLQHPGTFGKAPA
jgi:hypothetical protein